MKRLALPLLAWLAAGCAGMPSKDTKISSARCQVGELSWWNGALTHCSWNKFVRDGRAVSLDETN